MLFLEEVSSLSPNKRIVFKGACGRRLFELIRMEGSLLDPESDTVLVKDWNLPELPSGIPELPAGAWVTAKLGVLINAHLINTMLCLTVYPKTSHFVHKMTFLWATL